MSEIKPCPFCGEVPKITGDPDSEEYIRGYSMGFIECRNDSCPMLGNFIMAPTQKEATAVWNNRPIEDALRARIAELEAKLRWIPVSERLPKFGVSVLFYDSFLNIRHKGFLQEDNSQWRTDEGLFYYSDRCKHITHWMPLPEPPEEYQNEPA